MTQENKQAVIRVWKTYDYHIDLPLPQALEVRDQLQEKIQEIAREEGVEQILKDAQFDIQVGEPALDPQILILISIGGYFVMRTVDKITDKILDEAIDKAWEAWKTKILPRLKDDFGNTVLIEDKDDEEEED